MVKKILSILLPCLLFLTACVSQSKTEGDPTTPSTTIEARKLPLYTLEELVQLLEEGKAEQVYGHPCFVRFPLSPTSNENRDTLYFAPTTYKNEVFTLRPLRLLPEDSRLFEQQQEKHEIDLYYDAIRLIDKDRYEDVAVGMAYRLGIHSISRPTLHSTPEQSTYPDDLPGPAKGPTYLFEDLIQMLQDGSIVQLYNRPCTLRFHLAELPERKLQENVAGERLDCPLLQAMKLRFEGATYMLEVPCLTTEENNLLFDQAKVGGEVDVHYPILRFVRQRLRKQEEGGPVYAVEIGTGLDDPRPSISLPKTQQAPRLPNGISPRRASTSETPAIYSFEEVIQRLQDGRIVELYNRPCQLRFHIEELPKVQERKVQGEVVKCPVLSVSEVQMEGARYALKEAPCLLPKEKDLLQNGNVGGEVYFSYPRLRLVTLDLIKRDDKGDFYQVDFFDEENVGPQVALTAKR